MKTPLVSIITPTYNHQAFIAEAIESVIGQTFEDWELIIIDDGSQDKTLEIAKNFQNSRIHVYQQDHKGIYRLSETYNFALGLAKGDFIAILEGDDKWPLNKLEKQVPLFQEDSEIILAWGKGEIIDSQGRKIRDVATVESADFKVDFTVKEALQNLYQFNFLTPTSTVMVRKGALKNIGGFHQPPGIIFLDYPTWLILAAYSMGKFTFLNSLLGFWRTSHNQITTSKIKEMYASHDRTLLFFYQYLKENPSKKEPYGPQIESIFKFYQARTFLFEKKWLEARANFFECLSDKSLGRQQKLFSVAGLLSTLFRIDLISVVRWIKMNSPFAFSYRKVRR